MTGRRPPPLTRDLKQLVQKRVARDPAFGHALLREGIDTMLSGDIDAGKATLRDYIKATVGFEKLGEATGTSAKSLIRMLGRKKLWGGRRGNLPSSSPMKLMNGPHDAS